MLPTEVIARPARAGWSIQAVSIVLAIVAAAALLVPLVMAGPSHLSSDESLYLSEAYNIAEGHGFTYPSGEVITHRAPLYPLVLAPAVKAFGPDAAYPTAKLFVVLNVFLVMALAWRMGGSLAGWVAGLAAAASAYLSELGTTLYLDPMQCTFILLCVIALLRAIQTRRASMFAAAGVALGVAFLVKESAIQAAPISLLAVLALPSMRNRSGALGVIAFTFAFAATIAPWWIWVYAETGGVFMLGEPSTAMLAAGSALAVTTAIAVAIAWRFWRPSGALGAPLALVGIGVWGAFLVYGLTAFSTWSAPNDYFTTVPSYLTHVAPQMQPYLLILAAWAWLVWQGARGDENSRLLVVGAALFAPFALVAANRWLQLRDALPIVYLSYVALGVAAASIWAKMRTSIEGTAAMPILLAATAAAAVGFAAHEAIVFDHTVNREATVSEQAGSWDSPYTQDVAMWMDQHLPAGSHVLASRLYFSSLYVQTGGRFRIDQLPTVRVSVDPNNQPLVQSRSNLFRWGENDLRETQPGDTWLHLQQFPRKNYWVGLSEQELLEYVRLREIDYIVLTGEDVAFSSNAYAWYFVANPAFESLGTIEGTGGDRMYAFEVDRSRLRAIPHSTSIHPRDAARLVSLTGLTMDELSQRIGTTLRVTDGDALLSERENEATKDG